MICDRHRETAIKFGILEQCEAFEKDLLTIPHCVGVEFDLDGFYDNLNQVIFLTKYDIPVSLEAYFIVRTKFKIDVLQVAAKYGLKPSGDTIEDYGEHFYFVTKFDKNDKDWMKFNGN